MYHQLAQNQPNLNQWAPISPVPLIAVRVGWAITDWIPLIVVRLSPATTGTGAMAHRDWATILHGLSGTRSSIEAAAAFALDKPEQAMELFAAIVSRVQARSPQHLMAPVAFSCRTHAPPRAPLLVVG